MMPTGSQRLLKGVLPVLRKKPTCKKSGETKKDSRWVYHRLTDDLFLVLTNLRPGRRGNRATNNTLITKLTRGNFLKAMGAGVAWIALMNTPSSEPVGRMPNVQTFRSRPDLSPPAIAVSSQAHDTAPGYIFLAPKEGAGQDGPLIVDNSGQPVWFGPLQRRTERAMDFKVQRYRGEPVLTWWEGKVVGGHGLGEYVIADESYREIRRVRAGSGYHGDHHEFLITPQETALITIYNPVPTDLSPVGGPEDGMVLDGIAQEIDLETKEVLFEWHSLEHVGLEQTYRKPPKDSRWPFDYFFRTRKVFDYFHINSIDVDHDSNLLICSRWTFTVYKIDRRSGEIIWRLGGKKSDFEMGAGTWMRYQHDARRQSDGTITIFDNGGRYKDKQSYGLVLELDIDEMSASLVRSYGHPNKWRAASQGNMQVLPNDNVFIGWGSESVFSEFSKDGELLFDARFPPQVESYRAFRFPWSGHPSEEPAVAVEAGSHDEVKIYASWNGATEVASWQVLAGPGPDRLKPVGDAAPREGFETAIAVHTVEPYVGVQAKDRSGRVLGTSKALKPGN